MRFEIYVNNKRILYENVNKENAQALNKQSLDILLKNQTDFTF